MSKILVTGSDGRFGKILQKIDKKLIFKNKKQLNILSSKSISSSLLELAWDDELSVGVELVGAVTVESSSLEQASIIGIPSVAKTIGLHAVLRKYLLFFISIFCLKIIKKI